MLKNETKEHQDLFKTVEIRIMFAENFQFNLAKHSFVFFKLILCNNNIFTMEYICSDQDKKSEGIG